MTLLKSCQVIGVFWGEWTRRFPAEHAENVGELLQLHEKGAIRPVISERYPLERGGEAIAWLAGRKAMGKAVVRIG